MFRERIFSCLGYIIHCNEYDFFDFFSLNLMVVPPSLNKEPSSGMLSEFTKWLRIWRRIKNGQIR